MMESSKCSVYSQQAGLRAAAELKENDENCWWQLLDKGRRQPGAYDRAVLKGGVVDGPVMGG